MKDYKGDQRPVASDPSAKSQGKPVNILACVTMPRFESRLGVPIPRAGLACMTGSKPVTPLMETLAAIIRRWIEEHESSRPDWDQRRLELMQTLWSAVVGRSLARRTKAVAWRTDRLRVAVPDPVWRGQLETLAGPMLAAVQRWFPPHTVTGLDFVVDEHLCPSNSPEEGKAAVSHGGVPAAQASAELDLPLEAISDEELRELVREVASRFFSQAHS